MRSKSEGDGEGKRGGRWQEREVEKEDESDIIGKGERREKGMNEMLQYAYIQRETYYSDGPASLHR